MKGAWRLGGGAREVLAGSLWLLRRRRHLRSGGAMGTVKVSGRTAVAAVINLAILLLQFGEWRPSQESPRGLGGAGVSEVPGLWGRMEGCGPKRLQVGFGLGEG